MDNFIRKHFILVKGFHVSDSCAVFILLHDKYSLFHVFFFSFFFFGSFYMKLMHEHILYDVWNMLNFHV